MDRQILAVIGLGADATAQAIVDAAWARPECARAGTDITGLAVALCAGTDYAPDAYSLRDLVVSALAAISDEQGGALGRDAWGHAVSDGDSIYWADTGGYSEWTSDVADWWDARDGGAA